MHAQTYVHTHTHANALMHWQTKAHARILICICKSRRKSAFAHTSARASALGTKKFFKLPKIENLFVQNIFLTFLYRLVYTNFDWFFLENPLNFENVQLLLPQIYRAQTGRNREFIHSYFSSCLDICNFIVWIPYSSKYFSKFIPWRRCFKKICLCSLGIPVVNKDFSYRFGSLSSAFFSTPFLE